MVLTEAQVVALEKDKNTRRRRHGEFESEHPGYCGAQDTFYVGDLEGSWARLPADLHRYLQEYLRQALRSQDADHGSRFAQRPGDPVLRQPRCQAATGIDRPRQPVCGNPERHH